MSLKNIAIAFDQLINTLLGSEPWRIYIREGMAHASGFDAVVHGSGLNRCAVFLAGRALQTSLFRRVETLTTSTRIYKGVTQYGIR